VELDEIDTKSIAFTFPPAPRSGRVVVECRKVDKAYGTNHVLNKLDFVLERGEKVAFLGKNGEGKSTLSKLIVGSEKPTGGDIIFGYGVALGYYAQQQADLLAGNQTVLDVIETAAPAEMRSRARSLLGAFLFSGDDVNKPVSVLSGGEKSRLALARLLLQPTNLLVLDEPTNHLDMLSKEVLKNALMAYDGAMIVVSHDRDFLDGLTDKVIGFKAGRIREYLGDVDDFLRLDGQGAHHSPPPRRVVEEDEAVSAIDHREQQKALNREKKRLERRVQDLERQIGVQEKTIAECEKEMEDPATYADAVRAHKLTTRYETAKKLVASLMSEWEQAQQELEGVNT
jgi:ATP-binding cassette, subfamily F, member 3